MPDSQPDSRNVFVVHGRNDKARRALFSFLRSINLNPLEWSKVVQATIELDNDQNPHIGRILATGFAMARAAVVLSTPDDEARLKMEFWQASDGASEREFTGQPRQNVTFEAGMALGVHEDRTVIVELGRVRQMSDTLGRHVIRMDGSVQMRQDLAQRLKVAGCAVNLDGTDWHAEGDFEAAIAGETSPETAIDGLELESGTKSPPIDEPTDDAHGNGRGLHQSRRAPLVLVESAASPSWKRYKCRSGLLKQA